MEKILILSDSHDVLWPDFEEHIKNERYDRILHCGDVCSSNILRRFEAIAPTAAVKGNNDNYLDLPRERLFPLEGVRFYMVHDYCMAVKKPDEYDIMLSGHTHVFTEKTYQNRLFLNPGSCGRRRWDKTISYIEMIVDNGSFHYEHKTLLPEPMY